MFHIALVFLNNKKKASIKQYKIQEASFNEGKSFEKNFLKLFFSYTTENITKKKM